MNENQWNKSSGSAGSEVGSIEINQTKDDKSKSKKPSKVMKNSRNYLQKKKNLLKLKQLADFKGDFESSESISPFEQTNFKNQTDQIPTHEQKDTI